MTELELVTTAASMRRSIAFAPRPSGSSSCGSSRGARSADDARGPSVSAAARSAASQPGDVTLEAIGPHGVEPGVRLAGRAVELEDRDDGLVRHVPRQSRTRAGDELLELARDGVYRGGVGRIRADARAARVVGRRDRAIAARLRARRDRRARRLPGRRGARRESGSRRYDMAESEPTPEPDARSRARRRCPIPTPDPVPRRIDEPTLLGARWTSSGAISSGRMAALEAGGRPRRRARRSPRGRSFGAYADAAYADPDAGAAPGARARRSAHGRQSRRHPAVVGDRGRRDPRAAAAGDQRARRAASLGDPGWSSTGRTSIRRCNLDTIVAKQAAEKTQIASRQGEDPQGLAADRHVRRRLGRVAISSSAAAGQLPRGVSADPRDRVRPRDRGRIRGAAPRRRRLARSCSRRRRRPIRCARSCSRRARSSRTRRARRRPSTS